jgi:hypothetical protein
MEASQQLILMADTLTATTSHGLTATGWTLPTALTAEQWCEYGRVLGRLEEPSNGGSGIGGMQVLSGGKGRQRVKMQR